MSFFNNFILVICSKIFSASTDYDLVVYLACLIGYLYHRLIGTIGYFPHFFPLITAVTKSILEFVARNFHFYPQFELMIFPTTPFKLRTMLQVSLIDWHGSSDTFAQLSLRPLWCIYHNDTAVSIWIRN